MEPCASASFYQEMKIALQDARGLRQVWLLDYAERAERCNIDKQTLTDFIDQIWETHND